jgi:hypothetical protein
VALLFIPGAKIFVSFLDIFFLTNVSILDTFNPREETSMTTAESAVEELAAGMANAVRMREVGRLCLQAALTRLGDDIAQLCDVHAAAIALAPDGVAAEIRRLQNAAAESLAALKGYQP